MVVFLVLDRFLSKISLFSIIDYDKIDDLSFMALHVSSLREYTPWNDAAKEAVCCFTPLLARIDTYLEDLIRNAALVSPL